MRPVQKSMQQKIREQDSLITLQQSYLKPGECLFCQEATRVTTVLGSCISLTFYNPQNALGAITHSLMPCQNSPGEISQEQPCRFVDISIEYVLNWFKKLHIPLKQLEVKLFGGARMFQSTQQGVKDYLGVGEKNVQNALQTLKKYSLEVKVANVGGYRGRKLIFFSHTGEVWIKHLGKKI